PADGGPVGGRGRGIGADRGLAASSPHRQRGAGDAPGRLGRDRLALTSRWRSERDSNPRGLRLAVFKTAAINHSAIAPSGSLPERPGGVSPALFARPLRGAA